VTVSDDVRETGLIAEQMSVFSLEVLTFTIAIVSIVWAVAVALKDKK
jgi:hypothetical protein